MCWTPILQQAKSSIIDAPSPSRIIRWAKKDPDGGNFEAMLNPFNPQRLEKIKEWDEIADGGDLSKQDRAVKD
jgi:hypothetical protein